MLKKIVLWSTCGLLLAVALLWLADRLWPLPLPKDDLARVVLAEDGTPLWRFADANGVWRYPVQTDEVSPYYLEALLPTKTAGFISIRGLTRWLWAGQPGKTSVRLPATGRRCSTARSF